jgi:hypothetical protein
VNVRLVADVSGYVAALQRGALSTGFPPVDNSEEDR